jgi:hypothetical protein
MAETLPVPNPDFTPGFRVKPTRGRVNVQDIPPFSQAVIQLLKERSSTYRIPNVNNREYYRVFVSDTFWRNVSCSMWHGRIWSTPSSILRRNLLLDPVMLRLISSQTTLHLRLDYLAISDRTREKIHTTGLLRCSAQRRPAGSGRCI